MDDRNDSMMKKGQQVAAMPTTLSDRPLSTPPPSNKFPTQVNPLQAAFFQRRDLGYLEKLTCRVVAVLQTQGLADLHTISNAVKADPKAVAEVLDVLYATPLVSLEHPRKEADDVQEKNTSSGVGTTLKYTYTNNLHGLHNINAATYQHDYNVILAEVDATELRNRALRAAIEAKKRELEAVKLMNTID